MTSRERIRKFYKGEKIDKMPNGFMGCETAGIHMVGYEKCKKIFNVKNGTNRFFTFMYNSMPDIEFLNKAECDYIMVSTRTAGAPFWKDADKLWKKENLFGINVSVPKIFDYRHNADGSVDWINNGWHCPKGSLYFEERFDNNIDIDELYPEDWNPPVEFTDEQLREFEENAKWLYENTDLSLVMGETVLDLQVAPGGLANSFLYMGLYPERMKGYLDKANEITKKQLIQVDQAVGKYCDTMLIAHDFGDNNNVIIGPDFWRELYKPYYMDLFHFWHEHSHMKIAFHSCGSIREIIPDLIECGVDILNPLQVSAKGMSSKELVDNFGNDLIFYGGGYDATLCRGLSAEEVYKRCYEDVKNFSEKRKYIFAGVHNIPGDVSEEHLRAFFQVYQDLKNQ